MMRSLIFRSRLLALLAFFCSMSLFADGKALAVHGEGWGYIAAPPAGWSFDRRSLYRTGIEGLFLPEGMKYSPETTFACIVPPMVHFPAAQMPETDLAPSGELETASFQKVLVYMFDEPGPCRLFGIFEEDGRRFIFLLSAPTATDLESARPAFLELVTTFVLIAPEEEE